MPFWKRQTKRGVKGRSRSGATASERPDKMKERSSRGAGYFTRLKRRAMLKRILNGVKDVITSIVLPGVSLPGVNDNVQSDAPNQMRVDFVRLASALTVMFLVVAVVFGWINLELFERVLELIK